MTFLIGLDTTRPFHRAATLCRRSCAFTGNELGYQTLLKWAGEVAGSEPLTFVLAVQGRAASVLADWLRAKGRDVWQPAQTNLA